MAIFLESLDFHSFDFTLGNAHPSIGFFFLSKFDEAFSMFFSTNIKLSKTTFFGFFLKKHVEHLREVLGKFYKKYCFLFFNLDTKNQ